MRVGSLQMTTRYMTQLNRSYANQANLMEQGDGAKLHRPSDAPIGYSKYLRFNTSYGENDQYQYNIKTAVSWMKNTDAALVDMADAMKTVVEKANQAQGTNTASDMKAIASEMLVQVQQCVSDANTQVNGRYLFSGQADLIQPYTFSNDKYERGMTKTLDDKQAAFFDNASQSGDLTQMLVLEGDDGKKYFLNTQTGRVFTEDFVEEGYKKKIAEGQTSEGKPLNSVDAGNGVQADNSGVPENTNYHHYEQRLVDAGSPYTITGTDFAAATGLTDATMVVIKTGGVITHYGDPATGKVYDINFVNSYVAGSPIESVGTYPSGEFEPSPRVAKSAMTPASSGNTFASTGITVSDAFANSLGTGLTPASVASNLFLVTDSNDVPYYYYNDGSSGSYNVYSIADIATFSGTGTPTPIGTYPSAAYTQPQPPQLPVAPGFTTATGLSAAQLRIVTDTSGMPYYCDENGNLYDIEDTANNSGSWTSIGPFNSDQHQQVDSPNNSGFYVLRGVDDKDYYADIITGAIINEETYTTKVSVPITPPIPSPLGFIADNNAYIVGDLYAQNQKYTYDSVVGFDSGQQAYFGTSGATAFVKVTDADGNAFYYDPNTHDVYTEEFFMSGYQNSNTTTVKTIPYYEKGADAVDSMDALYVAENFDSRGVIKDDDTAKASGANWKTSYIIDGRTISMTLSTVSQYIVTYQGDRKQFSMVKENGAAQPATDSVNAGGVDIAGSSIFDNEDSGNEISGANAFNDLLTVVAMCERDDSRWMSSDSKTLANNSFNTVNIAQTVVAARQQVYSDCEEMLATQSETILEDITNVYATDVAKLAVDLMTAQTIYNLSLSFGSRVIPPTLADYM